MVEIVQSYCRVHTACRSGCMPAECYQTCRSVGWTLVSDSIPERLGTTDYLPARLWDRWGTNKTSLLAINFSRHLLWSWNLCWV